MEKCSDQRSETRCAEKAPNTVSTNQTAITVLRRRTTPCARRASISTTFYLASAALPRTAGWRLGVRLPAPSPCRRLRRRLRLVLDQLRRSAGRLQTGPPPRPRPPGGGP